MIIDTVFLISILLFCMPLFIPTWKWYWISSAFIGIPLLILWVQYFYDVSQPNFKSGPGGGLGLAIFGIPTVSFFVCMFARYCRWLLQIKINELKAKNAASKIT